MTNTGAIESPFCFQDNPLLGAQSLIQPFHKIRVRLHRDHFSFQIQFEI